MDGFNELQRGMARSTAQLVVDVMQNGKYSIDMACAALLRSQERTRGEAAVTDTLLYKVCEWLYTCRSLANFNTPGALVSAITADVGLPTSGVRYCLSAQPFNIPARLKPNRVGKSARSIPTVKVTTEPSAALASQLRPLPLVNELWHRAGDTKLRELVEALFQAELDDIKRRLS